MGKEQIAALRKKLQPVAIARPLLAKLDQVDAGAAIASIVKELDESFVRYQKLLAKQPKPITSLKLYWAGAEIEPWVPSTVMGSVYAGKVLLLDSQGGFEPVPLEILCDAAQDFETLGDDDAFDDLKQLFVAESLELATRAVAIAVERAPFAALTTSRPFEVVAVPGHDEPKVVLLRIE